MTESSLRVKALYTYPIKSIRGCTPSTLKATALGFAYDRRFMLMRVSDGQNMHVSSFTEMCLFTTELVSSSGQIEPDNIIVRYGKDHVFNSPEDAIEAKDLVVPLFPDVRSLGLEVVDVNMHQSPTTAYDMGGEYDEWFSKRFGYAVRLLYVAENRRKVLGNLSPHHAVHRTGQGDRQASGSSGGSWLGSLQAMASGLVSSVSGGANQQGGDGVYKGVDEGIGFADLAPFLIVSSKSWENVTRRLPHEEEEMDISKFRPNIVVEGADVEFEEDYWAEIHIGDSETGARVILTANCARCNSLNVDYSTGKVGTGESGKILKKLQKDRRIDLGTKWSPVFGRYGFLAQKSQSDGAEVEIKVGDTVQIVKQNGAHTRFQWPSLSTDS